MRCAERGIQLDGLPIGVMSRAVGQRERPEPWISPKAAGCVLPHSISVPMEVLVRILMFSSHRVYDLIAAAQLLWHRFFRPVCKY